MHPNDKPLVKCKVDFYRGGWECGHCGHWQEGMGHPEYVEGTDGARGYILKVLTCGVCDIQLYRPVVSTSPGVWPVRRQPIQSRGDLICCLWGRVSDPIEREIADDTG